MNIKIQNNNIHFDNNKITITYLENNNIIQRYSNIQQLIFKIENKENNSIGYLLNKWKNELKNLDFKNQDIEIQLIDDDEDNIIVLKNIDKIDFLIEITADKSSVEAIRFYYYIN